MELIFNIIKKSVIVKLYITCGTHILPPPHTHTQTHTHIYTHIYTHTNTYITISNHLKEVKSFW
jgi:hypothetical protein